MRIAVCLPGGERGRRVGYGKCALLFAWLGGVRQMSFTVCLVLMSGIDLMGVLSPVRSIFSCFKLVDFSIVDLAAKKSSIRIKIVSFLGVFLGAIDSMRKKFPIGIKIE